MPGNGKLGWILGVFGVVAWLASMLMPYLLNSSSQAMREATKQLEITTEFRTNVKRDIEDIKRTIERIHQQLLLVSEQTAKIALLEREMVLNKQQVDAAWQAIERASPERQPPRRPLQ